MPIKIEDRPLASVREDTIEVLIYNYSHGLITEEAFEKRLDLVMETDDPHKIVAQIADLEIPTKQATREYETPDMGIQYSQDTDVDSENIVCIFSGTERAGPWIVPRSLNTITLFGGSELDFSEAAFTSKQVTIRTFCMFGGVELNVPEGVQVSTSTICIFGGVSNKVRTKSFANDGPLIRVEGFVMFGGLDIKIKQTIKEKFVAFANQMKMMFDSKAKI